MTVAARRGSGTASVERVSAATTSLVFLVGAPDDTLLDLVGVRCAARGGTVRRLRKAEFLPLVTIRVEATETEVMPDGSLLARPDFPQEAGDGPDAEFAAIEEYAYFSAFTALSPRTVINRYVHWDVVRSVAVAARECDTEFAERLDGRIPRERYVSRLALREGMWDVQDLVTHRTGRLSDTWDEARPHRLREGRDEPYLTVVVVGGRSWVIGDYYGVSQELRATGVQLARQLGLDFCAISWQGRPVVGKPALAQIDPMPQPFRLGPLAPVVADALAVLLTT